MQPAADDILTREITLPDLNALPLDAASLTAPFLEIIDQQARVISSGTVKITALVATCREQAEQIVALKAALGEASTKPTAVWKPIPDSYDMPLAEVAG